MRTRIGFGFDSHRLVAGRHLILGGVTIPFDRGLDGHSDGDLLSHAVIDALLGAAALGDIGQSFPDTDPAYKGADSLILLKSVNQRVCGHGYAIGNIDATIIAQLPKLAPFIPAIRSSLSSVLGIDLEQISVKAKTAEHLGSLGRGEGLACHCVVLLERLGE